MKSNKKRQYSKLSKRILNRFFLSLLILLAVMMGGYFLAWFICKQFIWYDYSPFYSLFKTLQMLSPVIVLVVMAVGSITFMRKAIEKPLEYLDTVIDASKTLSEPEAPAISLPEELSDVENELNLARIQSQENLRLRKDAEQRKNDLIMYLAHDLKTPLSSVIGYLTLLHDEGEISPELREKYLSIALDKAERLEDLINEFFEITRFNLSHLELEKQPVDLCRMLQQVVSEFAPMLGERDLTCALELPPSLEYDCDPDKLARVFDNLLRNACHYSTPGSVVRISGGEEGDSIVLRFLNSGRTIPPEKLARIFDQFFRLDSSRATRTGGAGLGLAIAKEILTLHGGTITAWSREDQVCFQVTLPRGGQREEGPAREP